MEIIKMNSPCPNCGSKQTGTLFENMGDKMHFLKGRFSIIKCNNCELEFLYPFLNEKQLVRYYPAEEYYSFRKNKLFDLYQKISAKYYSGDNPLINAVLFPIRNMLHKYYNKNISGKKILEIGCGNGSELEVYSKYGLITAGIEPYGPDLTKREIQLGIQRKKIGEAEFRYNYFDYIILREVMEHVPDQAELMKKCRSWLIPRGKLVITVPNTKSLWRNMFGKNWYGYDVPRHLYDYNPKSIVFLLKKSGFKIGRIKILDLPYMIYGSIQFLMRSKKKELSIFAKLLFFPASMIISLTKRGSIIEIEAIK